MTEYEINGKEYEVDYDLDNRIIKVDVDNDDVEYRYDALGRRVIRQEGTTKTALIWWGNSECAEHKHQAGQTVIQNDIMAHPSRLNSVIARAVDGSKFKLEWYHKNYLDHVYAVSDDSGDILEHYRYTVFGEKYRRLVGILDLESEANVARRVSSREAAANQVQIYNASGTQVATTQIDNHILWNTRRRDALTGYYMYKFRHYSAELGRWLARDPIEERGGVNLYVFVGNDPIGRWDRLGLYTDTQIVNNVIKTMNAKGWTTAHKLMSLWWSKPANDNPKAFYNDDIVKMAWALKYPEAKKMYDNLTKSAYKSANAKRLLAKRLKAAGIWDTGGSFGYLNFKAIDFEAEGDNGEQYINSETYVGDPPLNDFGGALGRFQMRIAVGGCLDTSNGSKRFVLNEKYTYIVDSYDFNDPPTSINPKTWVNQPLGFWNFTANDVMNEIPLVGGHHYTYVTNKEFRNARAATGKGQDMLVFSDVKTDQTFDILDLTGM